MLSTSPRTRRSGAAALEAALVLPVVFLLTIGLIVGGIGVFNHQQVACQAREAARWASTRGADYQKDAYLTPPTLQQILDEVVKPLAAGMDASAITLEVQWVDKGTNTATDWDSATKDVRSITPGGEYVGNTVRVTVKYLWNPGVFLAPISLQSVSEVPMSF